VTVVLRRGIVLAALAVAVLAPAASASRTSQVELAIVPLPKSALGAAGHRLPIASDSGVVSNAEAASESSGNVTAKQLKHLGRVTGYLLDYGNPFAGGAGVTEIQTAVERYRSASAARKGLEFWRRDDLKNSALKRLGIDFSLHKVSLTGVAAPHWSYAAKVSLKGLRPLYGVDAEFQQGQYLLDVSTSAGSTSAARSSASSVVRRLYRRAQLALAGRLHANPVQLPRPPKPGPPAHGPKPENLVLTTTDVGSPATVLHKGYSKSTDAFDPLALSVYDQIMTPAGSFRYVSQEVLVGSSPLEVQYFGAIVVGGLATAFGNAATVTPVDLGSVGDGARGELLQITANGTTVYEALATLTHGPYLDFLVAASASALTASDVQSLAQLAAKRLDAGF
jgi:hypothetical protein